MFANDIFILVRPVTLYIHGKKPSCLDKMVEPRVNVSYF